MLYRNIYVKMRGGKQPALQTALHCFLYVVSHMSFLLALSFIISLPGVLSSNLTSALFLQCFYSPTLAYGEQSLVSYLLAEDTFYEAAWISVEESRG